MLGRRLRGSLGGALLVVYARSGTASDLDLDDDNTPVGAATSDTSFGSAPVAKPKSAPRRTYSLLESLALADRNHPTLWAARARLAGVHAQLNEARWTPFWQWRADAAFGLTPPV